MRRLEKSDASVSSTARTSATSRGGVVADRAGMHTQLTHEATTGGRRVSKEWDLCKTQTFISFLGQSRGVNHAAVDDFKTVSVLAAQTGYGQRVIAQAKLGKASAQTYNCRPISGSGGPVTPDDHSEHAHSIAV